MKQLINLVIWILLVLLWRWAYYAYQANEHYYFDIFRTSMEHVFPPFYILAEKWNDRMWAPIVIVVTALGLLYYSYVRIQKLGFVSVLVIASISALISAGFAYSEDVNRLWGISAHYETYANDLKYFGSSTQLFNDYIMMQAQLDVHGQHYPPGMHWVMLQAQLMGCLAYVKIFMYILYIASFFILFKLVQLFHHNVKTQKNTLLLFGCAPGLLIYNSIDVVAISMFLFISGVYVFNLMLLGRRDIFSACLFATVLFCYTMISFSVSMLALFCIILLILKYKSIDWKIFIKSCSISLLIFCSLHIVFYNITHFNIVACFINSISNNLSANHTSGYDDIIRYLIRSTGNILAFGASAGFMILWLIPYPQQSIYKAIWFTILLASFSGLFFGETERIWVFFIPTVAMLSAGRMSSVSDLKMKLLLNACLVFSLLEELFFRHYM